jgi:spermidine synthase
LGLGGGDILHHIRRRWPDCHLTAIEIDPAMIRIAKTYFKVNLIPHLKIITADAHNFIQLATRNSKLETTYDAILVDCYLGRQVPPQLESPKFLQNLKSLLSPSGTIAFNRLSASSNDFFLQNLTEIFPAVSSFKNYCNILIITKS